MSLQELSEAVEQSCKGITEGIDEVLRSDSSWRYLVPHREKRYKSEDDKPDLKYMGDLLSALSIVQGLENRRTNALVLLAV